MNAGRQKRNGKTCCELSSPTHHTEAGNERQLRPDSRTNTRVHEENRGVRDLQEVQLSTSATIISNIHEN